MNDQQYMQLALKMARESMDNQKGGPFGCIIVKDHQIIGRGTNEVTSSNDPTAHAEIVAIRDACKHLNNFQLEGCTIYTTCEPCPMCLGAIYWSRPAHIIFAGSREDAAAAGFDDSMIYRELTMPLAERKIPTTSIERDSAIELFNAWIQKENKILY